VARGKELYESIKQTPEYVAWEKHERTKAFDQIGTLLTFVDAMTGLHASAVYKQVLDIWRGDADYFSYLKTLVKMLPGGSAVAKVADDAIDLTEKVRKVAGQVQKGLSLVGDAGGVLQLAKDGGLLNAGSDLARANLGKQLAFLKDQKDLDQVKGMLGDSSLMKDALPSM
jgi:hypothetical protein